MPVFQLSTKIPGSLEAIYGFHTDTRNLAVIQPPGFSLVGCEMPPSPGAGSVLSLKVRFLGIPQSWVVLLEEQTPPHGEPRRARVIDRALTSPFGYWRHQHLFQEDEDGVRMTDVVDFDPPGGSWKWLLLPGCLVVLFLMFHFRHQATQKWFTERRFPH